MSPFKLQPEAARRPVIIGACRTPIGRAFGALKTVQAQDLVAPLLNRLLQDTQVAADQVTDVVLGNAAGGGGNIARLSALTAGLPVSVPGVSVDRQCGSGLEAIILAARLIQAGAGDCYLAGGVESVSTAPWRVAPPRAKGALPQFYGRARFAPDEIGDPEMGVAAEAVAQECGVTRARQDAFALASQRRAVSAARAGVYAQEIVPIETSGGLCRDDECPRPTASERVLAALKPAFVDGGTVTAGNACPLNDGASAVMIVSAEFARKLGMTSGLVFTDAAAAGVDPNRLGLGPVASTQRLLSRQPDLALSSVTTIEFNEAFAAQVLGSLDRLGIDAGRVNREGGAIALGHPFGASGAILVTRLLSQMRRRETDDALGLAMLGIGGGMGLTALFQWLNEL